MKLSVDTCEYFACFIGETVAIFSELSQGLPSSGVSLLAPEP